MLRQSLPMLKRTQTGSWMAIQALEKIGTQFVLGIPGVHNNELYLQLSKSKSIKTVLVAHELHGAYIADAITRTSSDQVGVLITVPGAGITHAASGIGEAFLAGIPMLIIATGVRSDTHYQFQLHDIDQQQLLAPITKHFIRVNQHQDIQSAIFHAYEACQADVPGPVAVEIPSNLLTYSGNVWMSGSAWMKTSKIFSATSKRKRTIPALKSPRITQAPTQNTHDLSSSTLSAPTLSPHRDMTLNLAIDMLIDAQHPGIYVGWGARHVVKQVIEIAERLHAPVATTLQGLSAFPHDHPLHTGMGFGPSATPPAKKAFSKCDCLLAIGTRFSELATAGYSLPVPKKLIHIDIDPNVFNRNYPATFTLAGDASAIIPKCLELLRALNPEAKFHRRHPLVEQIAKDKALHKRDWLSQVNHPELVNPAFFFSILDHNCPKDTILVTDDGHHTFLTAELKPIYYPGHFISPTDFNSMGYCIPAVIGAKMANPTKTVIGIVGDGAFRMSCMEIATAVSQKLGCIWFVFNDGELSQISHIQKKAYNRTFYTQLPNIDINGLAESLQAHALSIQNNSQCITTINNALQLADEGHAVVVNVPIDNSKKSQFTKGIIATQFQRLPIRDKVRMISRAVKQRVIKEPNEFVS